MAQANNRGYNRGNYGRNSESRGYSEDRRKNGRYEQSSTAYDYDRFPESDAARRREIERRRQERELEKKKRDAHLEQLKNAKAIDARIKRQICVIASVVIIVAVTLAFLGGKASQLSSEANEIQNSIKTLNEEYEIAKMAYDEKLGSMAIEEYATKNLGLRKRESTQIQWITVKFESDFEIFTDDNINDSIFS
ncbi:MAG: hypothetical protein LBL82_08415 [Oscillospiraceae bacterium]|nr:hypothetical protein [Oscillospiraceae bacterium]